MLNVIASTVIATTMLGADIAPLAPHPRAVVDLKTDAGAATVHAMWRGADVELVPRTQPGSYDMRPRIGSPGFDTEDWVSIPPTALEERRGGGGVSFVWYRLGITIPERIADTVVEGSTVILSLRIDDYAEVWVNGVLPYHFAQTGGAVVAGWNAPNRVTLTTSAAPGQTFDIAVLAANGPISEVPTNKIWVREATLEVYANPRAIPPTPTRASIERFDGALDDIIPPDAVVERVATGFIFTEGPVWDRANARLLFSDPNANTIYAYAPASGVSVVRCPSGYAGADIGEYRQPGSNGLTIDADGRLTINQHGLRRVIRLERDGSETVLAESFQGMRLNSPNDLVYRSDGGLYFTDPAFGLPGVYEDPRKETPFCGVYRLDARGLRLLTKDLKGPNGIALNHKETHLYVGDWDVQHKVVMRYPILVDGSIGPGEVFADLTSESGEEAIDGVKVDSVGNVYVCGPGGLWIFASDGRRLGLLRNAETPHNIAFGDPDGRTLYMTCHTGIYRVRLALGGPLP